MRKRECVSCKRACVRACVRESLSCAAFACFFESDTCVELLRRLYAGSSLS